MAEKNNKPSKTDGEKDDDVTPETAKTAASAKPMPWLVLIVGVLVMLLTPTASYFLVKLTNPPVASTEPEDAEPEDAKKEGHGAKKEGHGAKKGGHGAKKGGHGKAEEKVGDEKDAATFNMTSMLINIAETKGTRILKIAPHLILSEPAMSAKLTTIKALLVDTITSVASGKTLDELDGPTGRENLKKDIVQRLNKLLESRMTGSVVDIYFEEFLIQ